MMKNTRQTLVDAAMGRISCSIEIYNVQIVNVFTKEILPGRIFIKDEYIVDVDYTNESVCFASTRINGYHKYLCPGFIDSHLHVESSMLTPRNFVKLVLPFGTTTLITDPHELANVLGIEGIRYVLEKTEDLPINYYVLIPSCVPAVEGKENSGASFYADDIELLLSHERVIGIGEVMDYIGVSNNTERMVDIIDVGYRKNKFLQGHIPKGAGNILSAYLCGGPISCHESSTKEEALEKLRKGMWVDAREGSLAKNLKEVIKGLPDKNNPPCNFTFCTDDREANDIMKYGHINDIVRIAIEEGMSPVAAIQCVTINPAREYGLKHIGAIAPGYFADMIILENIHEIIPEIVFYRGNKVAEKGELTVDISELELDIEKKNTIILDDFSLDRLILYSKLPIDTEAWVNVMSFEDQYSLITNKKKVLLPVKDGCISLEKNPEYNYVAVINRYSGNNNISLGVIENFHIIGGALAGSVGHDCHNITVIYQNVEDAFLAVQRIKEIHGGSVAVKDREILGELSLSIGGLITPISAEKLSVEIEKYNKILLNELGMMHPSPILRSFFISLAVIPYIKMTDKGLIDVITQEFIATVIE